MNKNFEILVGVVMYSSIDHSTIKKFLSEIKEKLKILKISSIYSVKGKPLVVKSVHDIRSREFFQGLSLCLRCQTDLKPKEVIHLFEKTLSNYPERVQKDLKAYLLVFEDMVKILPHMTLPFSDLHSRPELAVPASELWGEYLHPVLDMTLGQIAKGYQLESWGEFYAQGEDVL